MDSLIMVGDLTAEETERFEKEYFEEVCQILKSEQAERCAALGFGLRARLESCLFDGEDHFFNKFNVPPPSSGGKTYRSRIIISLRTRGHDVQLGDFTDLAELPCARTKMTSFGCRRVYFADRFSISEDVTRAVNSLLRWVEDYTSDMDMSGYIDISPSHPRMDRIIREQ